MSNDGYVDVHLEYSSEVCEIEPFADGSLSHEELFALIRRPVLALIFSSETRRRLIVPKHGVFSKPPNGWFGGTITAVVTMPVVFEPPSRPGSQIADQKPFLDTVLGKRTHPTPEDNGPVPAKVAITHDQYGGFVAALPCQASSSTIESQPSLPVKPSNSRQFSFSAPVIRSFVPGEITNTGNGGGQSEDVPAQSVPTIPSRLDPVTGAELAFSTVANVAPHAIDAVSNNSINTNAGAVDKAPSSLTTAETAKDVSTISSEKTPTAPATTDVGTPASKPNTDDDDDVVILKVVTKKKASSAKAVSSSTSTSSTVPVKVEPISSEPDPGPFDAWLSAYDVPSLEALYELPQFKYSKDESGISRVESFKAVRKYILESFMNCVSEFKSKRWSINKFCVFRRRCISSEELRSCFPKNPLRNDEFYKLRGITVFSHIKIVTPALVKRIAVLLKHCNKMLLEKKTEIPK